MTPITLSDAIASHTSQRYLVMVPLPPSTVAHHEHFAHRSASEVCVRKLSSSRAVGSPSKSPKAVMLMAATRLPLSADDSRSLSLQPRRQEAGRESIAGPDRVEHLDRAAGRHEGRVTVAHPRARGTELHSDTGSSRDRGTRLRRPGLPVARL